MPSCVIPAELSTSHAVWVNESALARPEMLSAPQML